MVEQNQLLYINLNTPFHKITVVTMSICLLMRDFPFWSLSFWFCHLNRNFPFWMMSFWFCYLIRHFSVFYVIILLAYAFLYASVCVIFGFWMIIIDCYGLYVKCFWFVFCRFVTYCKNITAFAFWRIKTWVLHPYNV